MRSSDAQHCLLRCVAARCVIAARRHPRSRRRRRSEIVAAADKVRNPGQPFRSTDTLTEYVAGKARDQDQLVVYAKEDPATRQYRNLVRYVEPPRDAGKMVLLDGHNLWFYDPASKASVRISPQQRLIGQAAIGDILTVEFRDRLCRHARWATKPSPMPNTSSARAGIST